MGCPLTFKTKEGKHQIFVVLLLLRSCVLYCVASTCYDLLLSNALDDLVMSHVSTTVFNTTAIILISLSIILDVFTVLVSISGHRIILTFIMVSILFHCCLILPGMGYAIYVGVSVDFEKAPFSVDWMRDFREINARCSRENRTTEELEFLYEPLKNIEKELQCCGMSGAYDYYTNFCPNVKKNNTDFPWWAQAANQSRPVSCCKPKKGIDEVTCQFPNETRTFWNDVGCFPEVHYFIGRVFITIGAVGVTTEVIGTVIQATFFIFIKNIINEFNDYLKDHPSKSTSIEDDISRRAVQKAQENPEDKSKSKKSRKSQGMKKSQKDEHNQKSKRSRKSEKTQKESKKSTKKMTEREAGKTSVSVDDEGKRELS